MRSFAIPPLALLLAACGGQADGSDPGGSGYAYDPLEAWPQVGFGPGRSFTNPNEGKVGRGTAGTLKASWTEPESASGTLSAPIVAGEWAFATSLAATLEVFDARLGRSRHQIALGANATGAPAFANGYVFVTTKDRRLLAINASTLTVSWQADHTGALTPPVVSETTVYVGSAEGYVYAYDALGCGADHCLPDWVGPTASPVRATPAVAFEQLYVASADGALRAYPAAGCGKRGCAPVWSRKIGGDGSTSPTAGANRVFVAAAKNGGSELAAFDTSGNRVWRTAMESTPRNLATDGALVYGTTSHGLFAIDAAGGAVRFTSPIGGKVTGPPAIVGHALFLGILSDSGAPELLVIPDGCAGEVCAPVARIPAGTRHGLGPSSPAICRGRVYVASGKRLLAFQPR